MREKINSQYLLISLALLGALFYFMSESFYTISQRRTLLSFLILGGIILLMLAPSLSSKSYKDKTKLNQAPEVVDKELMPGEYHNDFSRVGSSYDRQYNSRPNSVDNDTLEQSEKLKFLK